MLEASEITVCSGSTLRLDKMSLALHPGELVVIVGPNGAGKSTLLQALAGQIAVSRGSVVLDGQLLKHWDRRTLARRRAVFSQHARVAFEFSVYDVVLLGRSPHVHVSETPADFQIVDGILDELGLVEFTQRVCNQLSGGEQQRVHIARVLAQVGEVDESNPAYLLLDEPASNLDIEHQHLAMQCFRERARRGAGVLTVLHDLNLAAAYADRILVVDNARVVAVGTPWEVFAPDLLGSVFNARFHVYEHPWLDCPCLLSAAQSPTKIPAPDGAVEIHSFH